MTASIGDRFAAVLATASPDDLAAWAATGRAGVLFLRDELSGAHTTEAATATSGREAIDNLTSAAAAIARAEPEAFLATFAGPGWASNSIVLVGLGRIDHEQATERLIEATYASNEWARMDAAIGLADRRSDAVGEALGRLLGDPQYLVRYHALASLATSGTPAVLPELERFEPTTDVERSLRDEALLRIAGHAPGHAPTD